MAKIQAFGVAVLLIFFSAGFGHADQIILKSGARGALSFSIGQAPDKFGGPSSGNVLGLKVTLAANSQPNPDLDGKSLCHLHGMATYERMRAERSFRAKAKNLIDLDAPLVAVRVEFVSESINGVSFTPRRDFYMRGLSKCRPFEE